MPTPKHPQNSEEGGDCYVNVHARPQVSHPRGLSASAAVVASSMVSSSKARTAPRSKKRARER